MTFTNVLENLITVCNVKQSVGLHCIYIINDAEEVCNWGNQIKSKQPFFFCSDIVDLVTNIWVILAVWPKKHSIDIVRPVKYECTWEL